MLEAIVSSIHFQVFDFLSIDCFWVTHRSTLCRQNVNLKRIHAVLLVAYDLMKYLHSVNLAADFLT